jgi:hypothetical protein
MWGQKENDKQKSLLAVGDCITRAANYTWWNWEDGSRLFWRWSEDYCQHIWDGIPLWYWGYPPWHFASQRKDKDREVRKNMGTKLITFFASLIFCVWLDPESDLFLLCAKRRYIYSDGV